MATVTTILEEGIPTLSLGEPHAPPATAVSWPAVLAGATAAAALSLILLVLGTGLGLAALSPWTAPSGTAIAWSTIIWISFVAFASSGLGGYLAGRLRTRWPGVHQDEVYFRDTAHGFLAWAAATLLTAAALTSVVGTVLGTAAPLAAAATVAVEGADAPADAAERSAYLVDALLRPGPATDPATTALPPMPEATRAEIARIFDRSLDEGALPADDARYVAGLVAPGTSLSAEAAEQRVREAFDAARTRMQETRQRALEIAGEARRNAAYASLWIFVSLLIGAFSASWMATFGGRLRDR